jgi:hypothetical protein
MILSQMVVNCRNMVCFPKKVCEGIERYWQYRFAYGKQVKNEQVKCNYIFHVKPGRFAG